MENLESYLVKEMVAEMKDFPEQDADEMKVYSKNELKMLRQKYGLMTPELTASEKNLIQKEQRQHAGK